MREVDENGGFFTSLPADSAYCNVFARKSRIELAPGLHADGDPEAVEKDAKIRAAAHIQTAYMALTGAAAALSVYEIEANARGGRKTGVVARVSRFDKTKPKRLAFTYENAYALWEVSSGHLA